MREKKMRVHSLRVTTAAVPIHSARAIRCSAFLPSSSRQDDKLFESALAACDKDAQDWCEKVAAMLPGKHPSEIESHLATLAEDVKAIEAGAVALPDYRLSIPGASEGGVHELKEEFAVLGQASGVNAMGSDRGKAGNVVAGKAILGKQERPCRGVSWSQEEHKLFLLGLEKFGKGDWQSISRHFVVTRTPTQVASHAQKYYNRQTYANKDKKRTSIHDIKLSKTKL